MHRNPSLPLLFRGEGRGEEKTLARHLAVVTLLLLAAAPARAGIFDAPDAGAPVIGIGAITFGPPRDEVKVLGTTTWYGARAQATTVKSIEDYHWAACGYESYSHFVTLTSSADAGWTGMLGRSGSSTCPTTEFSDVDIASFVDGGVRITGAFPKSATHRGGRGAVINLVPYQDFAVPREIGPVVPRAARPEGCLGTTERPGVHFEMYSWCWPTRNAQTCLAIANRCKVALDAEGFEFTRDGKAWVVGRGCVIPAHEHALVLEDPKDTPWALTLWVARCPAHEK
ncbi:MAG: hypothetical protein U0228_36740 [Myxococcaceae bacterium]